MRRVLAIILLLACCNVFHVAQAQKKPESKLKWKLGAQAYTFNRFTFFEAVDKIKACGLDYVEAFPGQIIGGGIEGKMDYNMPAETRKEILKKLKEKDVKLVAFGVVNADSEGEWKKLFEFAKAMGIRNITSEPHPDHLTLISSLCDKYNINLAIHNHPKPSRYWRPDIALAAIKGKSKRLGVYADIGHWIRSGLDPVASLQKLEGHIIQLHFKDLNKKAPNAHDVIWGQGVANVEGVLQELKKQGFQGVFSVEYEYNWDNNVPEVTESVAYFRATVKKIK